MRYVLTILFCIVVLAACEANKNEGTAETGSPVSSMPLAESAASETKPKVRPKVTESTQTHVGFIVYKAFEGGFYAFENNQGKRFTLLGLEKQFRRNGLKVQIKGVPQPDVMTTTQFGIPFRLSNITVLDDSGVSNAPTM